MPCFLNYFLDFPKKERESARTSTAWCALHTLPTPFSHGLCSTSVLCSCSGRQGLAWGRIMSQPVGENTHNFPVPETPHPVTTKAQQQFLGGCLKIAAHWHLLPAGGEAPCSLQEELFKRIKSYRKMLSLSTGLNNLYDWLWCWEQLMSTVQFQVQGLCLCCVYAVQGILAV